MLCVCSDILTYTNEISYSTYLFFKTCVALELQARGCEPLWFILPKPKIIVNTPLFE